MHGAGCRQRSGRNEDRLRIAEDQGKARRALERAEEDYEFQATDEAHCLLAVCHLLNRTFRSAWNVYNQGKAASP